MGSLAIRPVRLDPIGGKALFSATHFPPDLPDSRHPPVDTSCVDAHVINPLRQWSGLRVMKSYLTLSFRWLIVLALFASVGLVIGLDIGNGARRAMAAEARDADVQEAVAATLVVGDLAVPDGMHLVKLEGIGLVVNLAGTGGNPPISPQRAAMLDDMKKRGVRTPNHVLESTNTAIVLVRCYLRPGVRQGDRVDLEVQVPSRSETTSLRNGVLLETRLSEVAVLGSQIHEGTTLVLASGPVMVDPEGGGSDGKIELRKGRVLGGGILTKTRPLRLVLKPGHQSVRRSAEIGVALNRRFHTFTDGVKRGIAVPKTDDYIELIVHPRYKDNIERYVQVVRSTAVRESPAEEAKRILQLGQLLRDPPTARGAALQFEAIGKRSCDTLAEALRLRDPEIRFYAAEALAYLDDNRAAKPLGELARDEPAFRVFALTALSAMDAYEAHDELQQLLNSNSAETRYGAFRALWAMNRTDPLVRGEVLGRDINYHVIDTPEPTMIHVTRSFRPEIVMFGPNQTIRGPFSLEAGHDIMVTSRQGGRVSVARFAVGADEQRREVSTRLDDVIRAVVEVGGTYPDVVDLLLAAEEASLLSGRFRVDAVPRAGRTYTRVVQSGSSGAESDGAVADADSGANRFPLTSGFALPSLFASPDGGQATAPRRAKSESEEKGASSAKASEETNPLKRLFVRMKRGSDE